MLQERREIKDRLPDVSTAETQNGRRSKQPGRVVSLRLSGPPARCSEGKLTSLCSKSRSPDGLVFSDQILKRRDFTTRAEIRLLLCV